MAGMIEQAQMDSPDQSAGGMPPDQSVTPPDQGGGGPINAEDIKSKITVPPELKEPFQRVITAGLKVMYDQQTHDLAMKQLDGPGSMGEKLGKAIAGLLLMLFQQSNNTMPPQLMIPAGVFFIADAADFLQQAGKPVSTQDVGVAVETMLHLLFQQAGMSADRMYQMLDQLGLSKGADTAEDANDPADQGTEEDQAGQGGAPTDPNEANEPAAEETTETPDQESSEPPVDAQIKGQMQQRKNKAKRVKANRKGT